MAHQMLESIKRFIGISPIHPLLFYTGKLSCLILSGWFLSGWIEEGGGFIPIFMIISGLGILSVSFAHLGKSTRIGLPEESTELQTLGIYRFSRNPMYLALDIISSTSALYLMDGLALILALYCILIHHRIILAEEHFLSERFGDAYRIYTQNVRRYL